MNLKIVKYRTIFKLMIKIIYKNLDLLIITQIINNFDFLKTNIKLLQHLIILYLNICKCSSFLTAPTLDILPTLRSAIKTVLILR